MKPIPLLLALSVGFGVSPAPAQVQVRIAQGQAVPVLQGARAAAEEEQYGVRVELFENPNLDRFLRRAEQFLGQENWDSAITVLQDVVEGRTLEVTFGDEETSGDGASGDGASGDGEGEGEAKPPSAPESEEPSGAGVGDNELDASQAVFSRDGRIFHPVRRLCQSLLASMAPAGIDLYRTRFESEAQAIYEDAIAARSPAALESVYTRFFVTEASGRALWAAGDLLMDQGRFRGAIQVYRDLLESYPAEFRQRLQIRETWLHFKIALCLQLLGEDEGARQQLSTLAEAFPDESLRLMGELQTLAALPESAYFENSTVGRTAVAVARGNDQLIDRGTAELVPLWEFRFWDTEPYRDARGQNESYHQTTKAIPKVDQYGPGTAIAFDGEDALFLDHNRLRIHDGLSGLMHLESEGKVDPPTPRPGQARPRVPVYDWATMPTVAVGGRVFAIQCNESNSQRDERALLRNTLVAMDRESARILWTSENWSDAPDRLDDLTFLAAPTVFGDKLMVPVMHRESYCLQCLRQEDGAPIWRTAVHAGGTPYVRAPASPVTIESGVVFVLTNAGALAAIDAYTGDTRWIRRYERVHPLRKKPRSNRSNQRNSNYQFVEVKLPGFANAELLVVDGLVVFAPADGDVVLALDASTGEPVWMAGGSSRFAPFKDLRHLVGHNGRDLFFVSRSELVCIGLRSGLRRWMATLPPDQPSWAGRGLVTDEFVILPGPRRLLVFDANRGGSPRTLKLPEFSLGAEPLPGPCNLSIHGPFLAAAYEGGIEIYSTPTRLAAEAGKREDPLEAARWLEHAGQLREAADLLVTWLDGGGGDEAVRQSVTDRLLGISTEVAEATAANGDRAAAVALLDRCLPYCGARELRQRWHLSRLEFWRQLEDMDAYEKEQRALYSFMEGRD